MDVVVPEADTDLDDTSPSSLAFVDPCTPGVEVADPRQALDQLHPEWAAGDLMDRVELPDGGVLWIFGDTFAGTVRADGSLAPGWRFLRSSAIVQRGGCFDVIEAWGQGSWLPSIEPDVAVWPQEAVVVDDTLHVHAIRVRHNPDKAPGLDFDQVGGHVYIFDLEDLSVPRSMAADPPAIDGRPFGWGALDDGDGNVVVFAHHHERGTFVGRYDADRPGDNAAWTFWNGRAWVSEVAAAVPVAAQRLRVSPDPDGGYIGLALPYLDQRLFLYRSPAPQGPWQPEGELPLDSVMLDGVMFEGVMSEDVTSRGSEASGPPIDTWMYEPLLIAATPDRLVVGVNHLPFEPSRIPDAVASYGPRFAGIELP